MIRVSTRQHAIAEIARRERKVAVDALSQQFEVTPQTIRRDLAALCEARILARVHGGAMLAAGVRNVRYDTRTTMNEAAKEAIGQRCAADIPDDCSLFINIGTTTEAVARALIRHRNLMVITNNLNVADTLARNTDSEVVVAGGVLRRADNGLVGDATVDFIRQFKVDIAIIGASGIDRDGTLLDFDHREVRVAQAIIANARRSVLVADASKFTRAAPVRIANLAALDALYTDRAPSEEIASLCAEHGVELHLA